MGRSLEKQPTLSSHPELYPILASLSSPAEIRKLDTKSLIELAAEVRHAILNEVSKTGGHFSSNLGAVEIAVALFAVYDQPKDKVVWDTGHQAYAHKILSGRLDRFGTLRKHKGLSGFLRREESEYDSFGAGHAGTAISAALGFALARDTLGQNHHVVAVTGDAAIASGMSWEALNHGGSLQTPFTVVLNDNRMSIAPNVGALTNYLAKLRSRPSLQSMAKQAKSVVEKMPDPLTKVAAGLRHGITHYLAPDPTGTIFEELGFEYIGPVDGHDLATLIEVLRNVKNLEGPTFVHAMTVKGKGYEVSEDDARKWHAVIPFDLSANEMVKSLGAKTYTQAYGEAACECAVLDEKVVVLTAGMPDGTGLTEFSNRFSDRFHDVGIAEQHAVTLAAGMAAGGLKPFCTIYSTFLQRGYDQVVHDVALQNLPVRFFLDRAGLVGDDGPTHHGALDLSFLTSIPNMVVLAPKDTEELKAMVHWMANYDAHPTAVRYPRGASGMEANSRISDPIQLGKAEILREGSDIALIGIGSTVSSCIEAANALEDIGILATVINSRFAKPLDSSTLLTQVMKAGRAVIVEENSKRGGFGEAVAATLSVGGFNLASVDHLGLPDHFVEHGTQSLLRHETKIDADAIVAASLELCGKERRKVAELRPSSG